MPLYVYECAPCGKSRSEMKTIAQRHNGPSCDRCREPMRLVIGATPGIVRDPAVPKQRQYKK